MLSIRMVRRGRVSALSFVAQNVVKVNSGISGVLGVGDGVGSDSAGIILCP